MGFWSRFHSSKWIRENGIRTTAVVIRLDCDNEIWKLDTGGDWHYPPKYVIEARGYNPVSREEVTFREKDESLYRRLNKGQRITVYVNPEHASRYVMEV